VLPYAQTDYHTDWFSDYQLTKMIPLKVAKERNYVEVINVLIAAGARD